MMEEKTGTNDRVSDDYDFADRPLDFTGEAGVTALICEPDPAVREKLSASLKSELGYQVTAPVTAKDALNAMRFHLFDVVVLNDLFDTEDPKTNAVLAYLENMPMATRRRFFVALVGTYRTMDKMTAFNRSVNTVINMQDIDNVAKIIKGGAADNRLFYHVFQETQQKMGRV